MVFFVTSVKYFLIIFWCFQFRNTWFIKPLKANVTTVLSTNSSLIEPVIFFNTLRYSFLELRWMIFLSPFSSFLMLFCIFRMNITCISSFLVLLCIISFNIFFSCFINLARVSCCNIPVYFLFLFSIFSFATLDAINIFFCLCSLHDADFLFISSAPKLPISEDDSWTGLHLISYFLWDSVTTKSLFPFFKSLLFYSILNSV